MHKSLARKEKRSGKVPEDLSSTGSQIPNALEARFLIVCTGVTGTTKMFQTDRFGLHIKKVLIEGGRRRGDGG